MLSFDALKRWEDLGQFLEKAIIAYLDACHDLETALPNHSTRTSELLSRIEQRIAIFPTIISGPLASVQASIKRIRNSLASPVHRLPNEILARIFYISMYSVDVTDPLQVSRKHSATFIYRRLHVLAGVCSAWRRIGLQGYFWSLIPIVAKPNHEYGDEYTVAAARLSLQRAANLPLHLVTCIDSCATSAEIARNFILETVSLHGPQLSTVDVSDSSTGFFVSFLNVLLGSIASKQSTIHQLSLRCFQSFGLTPSLINDTGSPLPPAFHHLMNSLERLRIFRLRLPFRDISFGKLVEIRLQDIKARLRTSHFAVFTGTHYLTPVAHTEYDFYPHWKNNRVRLFTRGSSLYSPQLAETLP
ncbi:unnamed protein product [Rhizoctonia solani]|uniref:F-box domain-containing protein n=1 Tax=Rhizoctonia solani TaxID=456999 RepID=A0A8H3DY89_9AGAM|nr:unnamed protein product [Rhizoctonia solani]